jgi:hypothetical protein
MVTNFPEQCGAQFLSFHREPGILNLEQIMLLGFMASAYSRELVAINSPDVECAAAVNEKRHSGDEVGLVGGEAQSTAARCIGRMA